MSFLFSPDLSFIHVSKCWFLLIPEFGQSPANYYFKYLQKHVLDITFYECILCISTLSWCLGHWAGLLSSTWLKCNVRKIWVMLRILCLLRQLIRCLIWSYGNILILRHGVYSDRTQRQWLYWSPKYLDDCFWPFLIVFCFRSDLNSFLQMSLILIVFRLHFQWQFLKWRIWNFRKLSSKDCLWLSYPIKCWSSRSGAASLPSTQWTII